MIHNIFKLKEIFLENKQQGHIKIKYYLLNFEQRNSLVEYL